MAFSVKPTIVFIVSTFIFSSVSLNHVSESSRTCHWCGPLAEQVHRSQRPARCGEPGDAFTVCDPGFNYCAIMATTPPYVESRLCVKIYQDECYPLYCNTTKIWRMTCPCKTDMCNGEKTEREIEAFAELNKIASRHNRTNKNKSKRSIDDNGDNTHLMSNASKDKPELHKDEEVVNTEPKVNETKPEDTSETKTQKSKESDNNINSIGGTEERMEHKLVTNAIEKREDKALEIMSMPTQSPSKAPKEEKHETTATTLKTTEKLPQAESLQQSSNPVTVLEKNSEPTTTVATSVKMTTVTSSTEMENTHANEPTTPHHKKGNSATKSYQSLVILMTSFIVISLVEKII